ncbi:MAG: hypothetical protein HFACDABA_00833 [Anaerolineales bacterium]|nr:hypothetical protein [Anaerolineales bacterium]
MERPEDDGTALIVVRAVLFDLGGVILRTEHEAPRQHLAGRLGVEYDDLVRLVFESETSRKASLGVISEEDHWRSVTKNLKWDGDPFAFRDEFFSGDALDHDLLNFLRSLRGRALPGLISNAWSGLRQYILEHNFEDAFDAMIISAEVGVVKPNPKIYHMALDQLDVRPNEAVFVDDFIENVKGAQAVGMSAIHFKDSGETLAQLKKLLKN